MCTSSSKEKINKVSTINIMKAIKSKFILKNMFSLLYLKRKLNLIKYNKKFQKIFEIDVNYYK